MNIAAEARKLRDKELGSGSAKATPVIAIAQTLGYVVTEFKPDKGTENILGAISHNPKTIYVNADQIPSRKRFTIAHEIGHAVLHADQVESDGIVDYRGSMDYGYEGEAKEREANQFAAALLMPSDLFESLWIAYQNDLSSVSEHLQVSKEAAKYRAKSLGLL